ncbi:MAG: hypothetical protein LBJ77_00730 [Holosporales bacterium]|jgi:hypothetical protein|nr:hypothetical protein [Holosporales bacterium]
MSKIQFNALLILAISVSGAKSAEVTTIIGPASTYDCKRYITGAVIGVGASALAICIAKNSCDKNQTSGASFFTYGGAIIGGCIGGYYAGKSSGEDDESTTAFVSRIPGIIQGMTIGAEIGCKCAELGRFLSDTSKYSTKSSIGTAVTEMFATALTVSYSAFQGAEMIGKFPVQQSQEAD